MTDRLLTDDRYFKRPTLDPEKYQRIIYDPGLVTRIILNRPRYLNATSHAELAEIDDAFDHAAVDDNCNVVVLSGNGNSFCSGDDVMGLTPESAPTLWDGAARPVEKLIEQYGSESAVWHQFNIEHDYFIGSADGLSPFLTKVRAMPKPTIAMVHGYTSFYGYWLSQACDLVFAEENTLFLGAGIGLKELWNMGPRMAMEFLLEHRFMTAQEALELRMINRVYPGRETLERETLAFAYRIADENADGLRHAKEAFLNMQDILGFTTINTLGRTPYSDAWRKMAAGGHRNRYEGKGMARTPLALANLRDKLQAEGKPVPANVQAAIERASARDDQGTWQRVLHSEWREHERLERTDASAANYAKFVEEQKRRKSEEVARRGLNIPGVEKVGLERIRD